MDKEQSKALRALEMGRVYQQLRRTKRSRMTWLSPLCWEWDWRGENFVREIIEQDFADKILNRAIKRAREEFYKAKELAEEEAENARALIPGE